MGISSARDANISNTKAKSAVQAFQKPVVDGCCECIPITPADFGVGRDKTYVITTPGVYKLTTDVAFMPAGPYTPAINILSDDVVLGIMYI